MKLIGFRVTKSEKVTLLYGKTKEARYEATRQITTSNAAGGRLM
jgi:hypothetical protein